MKENPKDAATQIRDLEKELKDKQSTIELLQERLKNNEDMLQDSIQEKNQLKERIQEYDLNLTDAKLNQHQKLQEDHRKTVHRLQVTKTHLDKTNDEIDILKKVIEDLTNRGLLDHIRGKYPESFENYRRDEFL